MFLSGKIVELTVGLINILVAVDPFYWLPGAYRLPAQGGRSLIITASGVLIFGALLAKNQHRRNILLFWLKALVIYIATIIYEIRQQYEDTNILVLLTYILVLVVMGLLIYRVYNAEIETPTLNPLEHETKAEEIGDKKKEPQPTAPEDQNPPPYEVKSLTDQIV
ncbi:uncharacterized protein [Drosophila suzukii]|uniref:Uncharacterized protein n=1 Tax=Drosophila suzukii TaxID=28584 RepID=A0AB39ZPY8_DROSZ